VATLVETLVETLVATPVMMLLETPVAVNQPMGARPKLAKQPRLLDRPEATLSIVLSSGQGTGRGDPAKEMQGWQTSTR